jgi:hypothetical protein
MMGMEPRTHMVGRHSTTKPPLLNHVFISLIMYFLIFFYSAGEGVHTRQVSALALSYILQPCLTLIWQS